MKNIIVLLTMAILNLPLVAQAQKWIKIDLVSWVNSVPEIPATVSEVHGKFSLPSSEGERFADAVILNPFHSQVERWLSEIHSETVNKKITDQRNNEMTYEVQFNDEMLKLALRPLKGEQVMHQLSKDPVSKKISLQLFELEKSFDWRQYYSAYDEVMKEQFSRNSDWNSLAQELRDQIPMVETEYGKQKDPIKEKEVEDLLVRKKLEDGVAIFQQHQKAWSAYFHMFRSSIIKLQEITNSFYFDKADKHLISYISDVQARALEAIGKMIWLEYVIVGYGELVFQDWKMMKESLSDFERHTK